MAQVDADQIVDNKIPVSPVKPIPRDLGGDLAIAPGAPSRRRESPTPPDLSNPFTPNVGAMPGDAIEQPTPRPSVPTTPALIRIKSQTINMKDDGTATVDVVLEVEDIKGVTDYEVRISKDARTV